MGRVFVLNVRTFSEQDYRDTGEWLLPPKPRGIVDIGRDLADELRGPLLSPLGVRMSAPARVAFYDFGDARCFYNFRSENAEIELDGKSSRLGANRLLWLDGKPRNQSRGTLDPKSHPERQQTSRSDRFNPWLVSLENWAWTEWRGRPISAPLP